MKKTGTVYKGEAKPKADVTLIMSDDIFTQLSDGKACSRGIGREKSFSCKLVDQRPKGFHDRQAEDERQHYACHKARRCPRSEFIFSAVVAISLITVLHSSQRRRRLSYRYLFVVGYSIYVVIIILCCY